MEFKRWGSWCCHERVVYRQSGHWDLDLLDFFWIFIIDVDDFSRRCRGCPGHRRHSRGHWSRVRWGFGDSKCHYWDLSWDISKNFEECGLSGL